MILLRFLTGLFLLSYFPLTMQAQQVLYSPYQQYDFRTGNYSIAGKIGDKLYIYRSASDGFYLDAYSDNMELQATVILDFFPQRISETKFIAYSDKILVLYQWIDGNQVVQSAALLDGAAKLIKGPIKLDSEKRGMFSSNRDYFSYAVSEDKTHIMIYGVNEKRKSISVKCICIDDELQVKQRFTADFETGNDPGYGEGMMNNDGTFFLPVYTPIGNSGYTDQLWILTVAGGARKFVPFELPLNDKYAGHTFAKVDNNSNRLYIGGFYSDKKNGNLQGVLYAYFDVAAGTFQSNKFIPFSDKMRNTAGESSRKRAFDDYRVRDLIVKNDGGFLMIAEDYFITSRNSYAPGFGYYSWYSPVMSSSIREYHYENILVMSYDGDGTQEWSSFIRKDQYSQEDEGLFSSYGLVNTGGTLGFLFNDFNARRSRIQLATVDASGSIGMRALDAGQPDDPDWLPRSSKQVAAREIVVPCLRKRQICFAKIIF